MNRCLVLLFSLLMVGCSSAPAERELVSPMLKATQDRLAAVGIKDCERVLAFAIKPGSSAGPDLIVNGRLNVNRAPMDGIALIDKEINVFLDATTVKEHPSTPMYCYIPHHGLVFMGRGERVLGHYTICFTCFREHHSVGRFVERPDYSALKRLFKDVGLYDVKRVKGM